MPLKDLFIHRDEHEIRRSITIKKAETISKAKSIEFYDHYAAEAIQNYKQAIELLEEYRRSLFERYQEIVSAPFKLVLMLERKSNYYDGKKSYIITLVKRFDSETIDDEEMICEKFPGKERHKALKRFEDLKKEYPTTETEVDIDKKHWEK